jgi:hypothetical protein
LLSSTPLVRRWCLAQRGIVVTTAAAVALVVGLTGPAALLCLPSCSSEKRGVGCLFLDVVFPFVLSVIVIYQPCTSLRMTVRMRW